MEAVKRIEIVVDSIEIPHLLAQLEKAGAPAYTVIRDVQGKGVRGSRDADELTGVFQNSYVLVACSEQVAQSLVQAVRPILKRFGGMCLVSDAQYILH